MRLPRVRLEVRRMMVAAVILNAAGAAAAQEVVFRLPEDDPNTNSDVIRSAAFSPDGSLLAVGYGRFIGMLQEPRPGQAVVWDARSGGRKSTVAGREDGVCSVAFSPDGTTLAVAEFPGVIRLWDVAGGRERLTIRAPAWTPGTVAFSPDGRRLAAGLWTGGKDGVSPPGNGVALWDAATGKLGHRLGGHTEAVHVVAFSPDGRRLVSGGEDGAARVWDVESGRERAALKFPALDRRLGVAAPAWVEAVAFSPDGRTLVTAAGSRLAPGKPVGVGEVTVWGLAEGRELATLEGFEGVVLGLAFRPDGGLLATAGGDGVVRLWSTTTFRQVGEMKGDAPVVFSPDGRDLVARVGDRALARRRVAGALRR